MVRAGRSTAVAGIKLEVSHPDPETPEEGFFNVQLTERLRDLLTAPEFCDLGQLSIAGGKAVWALYLDIYVIDDDGSLLDVCLLAALAALRALRLPKVEMNKEGSVVLSEDSSEERPLHLKTLLCALTAGQLDGKLLVDLTSEEEGLVDSKVELVVDAEGNIQGLTGLMHRGPAKAVCDGVASLLRQRLERLRGTL
ncbi:hypothetical protein QBZ16_001821 [Prototheca wickerhamii]|uniref:Ribosomal RNA-processing protein 43 n=1 Tax=Prototheca wickerhamii TaxID=3111 RepID=A0AAD9IG85_PROWI|nr:hypothetical protein QBZ16_001821 [Prototheca wickerhamii]